MGLEVAYQVIAGQGGGGLLGADGGMAVAAFAAKYQAGHHLFSDKGWLVLGPPQVGQMLPLHAFQFMFREGGMQDQVGHQAQGVGPVPGQGLAGQQGDFPPSLSGYAGAHEFEGGGYLLAGTGLRALGQHLGGETGQAWQVRRVGDGPGGQHQREGYDGQSRLLQHGNAHAVGQRAPLWNGGCEGRLPGRIGHDRPVEGDGGRVEGRLGKYPQPDLTGTEHPFPNIQNIVPLHRHVIVDTGVNQVRVAGEDVEVIQIVGPSPKPPMRANWR